MTNSAVSICLVLFGIHAPSQAIPDDVALATCVRAFNAAESAGEDPVEVAAQAGIESRWNPDARAKDGSVGALQVKPRFFCPDKTEAGCDLVVAGIRARKAWRAAARRTFGAKSKAVDALCMYQGGYSYKTARGCAYGLRILDMTQRARRQM